MTKKLKLAICLSALAASTAFSQQRLIEQVSVPLYAQDKNGIAESQIIMVHKGDEFSIEANFIAARKKTLFSKILKGAGVAAVAYQSRQLVQHYFNENKRTGIQRGANNNWLLPVGAGMVLTADKFLPKSTPQTNISYQLYNNKNELISQTQLPITNIKKPFVIRDRVTEDGYLKVQFVNDIKRSVKNGMINISIKNSGITPTITNAATNTAPIQQKPRTIGTMMVAEVDPDYEFDWDTYGDGEDLGNVAVSTGGGSSSSSSGIAFPSLPGSLIGGNPTSVVGGGGGAATTPAANPVKPTQPTKPQQGPCITAPLKPTDPSNTNSYLKNLAQAFFGSSAMQGLNISFSTIPPNGSNLYLVNGQYYDNPNGTGIYYLGFYYNNTIYISPNIVNGELNSIIIEIGHELLHAIIANNPNLSNMNYHTQEYLAGIYESQIWTALGNTKMANAFLQAANQIKVNSPDFNATQANSFQFPSIPKPPCPTS